MHDLNPDDYHWILGLFTALDDLGTGDINLRWRFLLSQLEERVCASQGMVVIQRYQPAPTHGEPGFRTVFIDSRTAIPQAQLDFARDPTEGRPRCDDDPVTLVARELLLNNGAIAFTHRKLVAALPEDQRQEIPSQRLLEKLEVSDRLMGVVPISDEVIVSYCLDRRTGEASFTDKEIRWLEAILPGLHRISRDLVASMGFFPGQECLTPREQVVLQLLLGPMSQKEIAHELGLSSYYIRDVIKAIYRKLKVQSRPELMAHWISGNPLKPLKRQH